VFVFVYAGGTFITILPTPYRQRSAWNRNTFAATHHCTGHVAGDNIIPVISAAARIHNNIIATVNDDVTRVPVCGISRQPPQ